MTGWQQSVMATLKAILQVTAAGLMLWGLTACDQQRAAKLEEGVSTEVQVREQFGEPVTITTEADGSRVFEYPRQPEGWTNVVITLGPDGKMSSLRQLLHEGNFAKVTPGLDKMQVRKLLGRPAKTVVYQLKDEEVWDWRFHPNPNESKLFSVVFDREGRVLRSSVGEDPREAQPGGR